MSSTARPPSTEAQDTSLLISHDARTRTRTRTGTGCKDGGQAAVLVVSLAGVLLVVLMVALGALGRTALDRTRAQSAADAAALASLDGGRLAADDLAQRHGASVVAWSVGPGPFEVTVTVRVGDTTATARASDAP